MLVTCDEMRLMVEEIVVTDNKMLKGGDERPLWLWCFVSFSPPRCEFYTS